MVILPSVRHLRHLVALADHEHFGHAAAACHVTQSTLSASIKELEALLEAGLVDRTKRRVVFTPLGLETVSRARKIIAELEELADAARASREPLSGTVRMGVIPTIGPYLLPRLLPGLRRAYVRLKLYLIEDLTARLIEALHEGKLDLALLALPYECGAVETWILFEDAFLVAFPRSRALANEVHITPKQLMNEELLLLKDGHCLRDHALAACHLAGRRQAEAFEATSLPTLVQMADNGLGTTLLPAIAVKAGLLRGTGLITRPFVSDNPAREIGLVWRKGTGRRHEFLVLAEELARRASQNSSKKAGARLQAL
ncbi:MAG: hydrogen peroxide-inducible genes activator [Rhodomicrobium sp.]